MKYLNIIKILATSKNKFSMIIQFKILIIKKKLQGFLEKTKYLLINAKNMRNLNIKIMSCL